MSTNLINTRSERKGGLNILIEGRHPLTYFLYMPLAITEDRINHTDVSSCAVPIRFLQVLLVLGKATSTNSKGMTYLIALWLSQPGQHQFQGLQFIPA